jgi:hypothetical protein
MVTIFRFKKVSKIAGILHTKSHPYPIPLLLGIDKPSRQDYIMTKLCKFREERDYGKS